MELPANIQEAINELSNDPEIRKAAAVGITAISGVRIITKLEEAQESMQKLLVALHALGKGHKLNVSAIEEAEMYTTAALEAFMKVTEDEKETTND